MSFAIPRSDATNDGVKTVIDCLGRNYTLDENPGMGAEGAYHYHLMTKVLRAQGVKELTVPDGETIDWREALSAKLIALQQPDNSWQNPTKRWMESDPELTAAYVIMTLNLPGEKQSIC